MPVPVKFIETELPGVLEVEVPRYGDDRGFFSEVHSQKNWEAAGFTGTFVQDNLSQSDRGTLRGMHYQLDPHGMGKLVRVLSGSVFDVAVDLRIGSPTFGRWVGSTLSAENHLALWVPAGFAHGFLALEDKSLVYYKCTGHYAPESERVVSFNDPEIGIEWPFEPTIIGPRDVDAPMLKEADHNFVFENVQE